MDKISNLQKVIESQKNEKEKDKAYNVEIMNQIVDLTNQQSLFYNEKNKLISQIENMKNLY